MLNPLFELGRIERSKDVSLKFVDAENNFVVVFPEDVIDKKTGLQIGNKGDMKYAGRIIEQNPHMDDNCTCPSFFHGNVSKWTDEHGYAFQCKHVIAARSIRYQNHPEPENNPISKNFDQKLVQTDLLL